MSTNQHPSRNEEHGAPQRRSHPTRRSPAAERRTDAVVHTPSKTPILAQRFRTKLCNKFATTGSCPYLHRCMFAHGEAELRTAGQNVADGLVSEEAIRAFKREQYEARLRAEAVAKVQGNCPDHVAANLLFSLADSTFESTAVLPSFRAQAARRGWFAADERAVVPWWPQPAEQASLSASVRVSEHSQSVTTNKRWYRHDPYAEASAWHPLQSSAADTSSASATRAAARLALPLMERSVSLTSLSTSSSSTCNE